MASKGGKKKKARNLVGLLCEECNTQNYVTSYNKQNAEGKKLVLRKYCKVCHKHTNHKMREKLK